MSVLRNDSDLAPALAVEQVTKSYDGKRILDSMNVQVTDGQLVSLLGPSGCGKTTTLNIVAGFVRPDEGRVLIKGKDISHDPPYRRDTAIVFQNYALFPHMDVAENVGYGLKARKVEKAARSQRVAEALELMGIAGYAGRYPSQLSGGQQQRVAVARAVAVQPTVLLMDEPLSNLDAKLRAEIRIELRSLQRRLGQSVLFVTHDQEEALAISDQIVVMNLGKIEQQGTPAELFDSPATVFVANFLGVENVLAGRAVEGRWRSDTGLELPMPKTPMAEHIGIRPSQVGVNVANGVGVSEDAAHYAGRVLSRTYLGDSVRLDLDVSGTKLVALTSKLSGDVREGDACIVSLHAAALLPLEGSRS